MRNVWRMLARSLADPGLLRLRTAAVTYATAVICGALASIPAAMLGIGPSIVVLAVMLSISFTDERAGATAAQRWISLGMLPLVGIAAVAVAGLMVGVPVLGDAVFVVVLSAGIWVRRYGPTASRIGTLVALPFIAVLVVPAPVQPGAGFSLWGAVVALLVAVVALLVQWLARLTGVTPRRARPPRAPAAPRSAVTTSASAMPSDARATTQAPAAAAASAGSERPGAAGARGRMRPIASTRMAIQLAVTLTGAFLIGHLVFGEHWFWCVLTAYLVASGNRGRGDVVYKGIHRTIGAAAGTVVAAVLSLLAATGPMSPQAAGMSVLTIAVILALGLWLRPAGYGWWAAAMTAMLSILQELTGTQPGPVMLVRLAAIVVAGAFAVAVAWWVLPVRTGDALRARTAAALAALTDLLLACIREPDAVPHRRADLDEAITRLKQLGPTLRLERATRMRRRTEDHRADVIPALEACSPPADAVASRVEHRDLLSAAESRQAGALARRLGEYRRMLVGAPVPLESLETPAFPDLGAAVADLAAPLRLVARPTEPDATTHGDARPHR
ncbi:FUSC family protein [Rathayibacter sp. CAU 1779]